jgi:MarR family
LEQDIPQGAGQDVTSMEAALTRVWARWERAIEQLGGAVPATHLRALLIIDDSGPLLPGQLALALGTSVSGASRLSDRMTAAGLLGSELAVGSPLEIRLAITKAGQSWRAGSGSGAAWFSPTSLSRRARTATRPWHVA